MTQEVIYTGKPVDPDVEEHRLSENVKHYQEAIAIDPGNVSLYKALGSVYEELGQLEEAERVYLKASELTPHDTSIDFSLGCIYIHQNRNEDAVQKFKRYLRHSTDRERRTEAYENLMRLKVEQSEDDVLAEDPWLVEDERDQSEEILEIEQMYRSLSNLGTFFISFGGWNFIYGFTGGNWSAVWSVLWFILAGLSWKIKLPAMYVLYGMVIVISTFLKGLVLFGMENYWTFVELPLMIVISYVILKQYRRYRYFPLQELYRAGIWSESLDPPRDEEKITEIFAIVSSILAVGAGIFSVILLSVDFDNYVVMAAQSFSVSIILMLGILLLAILAFALGSAALASTNIRKASAVIGILVSGIILLGISCSLTLARISYS